MFSRPDYYMGVPGDYTYAACRGCDSVYQAPMVDPADVALCYPESYYTHSRGPESHGGTRLLAGVRDKLRTAVQALAGSRRDAVANLHGPRWPIRAVRERAYFGLLEELIPTSNGARALEVGTGAGDLLRQLSRAGWAAEGIEPDPIAAAIARTATGLPVHNTTLLGSDLEPGAYELVVLSHVLEHLADPVAALHRLAECISARGRIVLIYPNIGSLAAESFGPDWIHWDPPRHLFLPSERGLRAAVARAHLRLRSIRTLARAAAQTMAASRCVRARRVVQDARVSSRDRLFAWREALFVGLGRPCGEEVVACVEP
jgi:2-polyprenyl-3-methyl-5-hydroxy-6-metoxy-1,4-benzoquinol methylase